MLSRSEVYSKDSSAWEKTKDIAGFAVEQLQPFAVQGYKRMKEHGASDFEALAPAFGFPIAPSYLTRSDMQSYIYDKSRERRGISQKELANRYEWKISLRKALKAKDIVRAKAIAKEGLQKNYTTIKGLMYYTRNLKTPPDVLMFKEIGRAHV